MAGESLDQARFWLPPHFLSDHDNLAGKPTTAAAFPYDFASSALDSPLESLSTDDDREDDDDEEDFLAALTQRLTQSTLRDSQRLIAVPPLSHNQSKSEAKAALAGSPQSTLSGFGSWSASDGSPSGPSQAPSPPTTPFGGENNTWDLIYAAAGQVARLKLNGEGLIAPPQSSSDLVPPIQKHLIGAGFHSQASPFGTEFQSCFNWGRQVKVENQQIQRRGGDFHHENGRFLRPVDFPQSTWPSLQPPHRRNPPQTCAPTMPPAFHGGGSAPKKECAGTGVFLPRRYDNPPQSRKRPDSASIPLFQGMKVQVPNRSAPQTTSNRRLPPSYEALMAQRNAIFAQQRLIYSRPAERGKSHEFLLPQEWTY
ncbi:uncharacterized protein LOC111009981 [Momordica charantia]|uniref:Uncharacterized protein LOC111009981 n=1 Tax=Momordica charantia TaxID=3673 RepID=A0A6J1CB39_MOMCH|nr:uncharacterized protein LOC111009981 [Momordica charantia]